MMSLATLGRMYKEWKKVKGAIKQVTGSGAYKILMISGRVDKMIADYQLYLKTKNGQALKDIKARMRTIKEELTSLATTTPAIPKFSKDAPLKSAEAMLEAHNTSEMAQMELMRVYMEQLQGGLPDDEANYWPGRRARLVNGSEAFRKAAVEQLSYARSVQRDIDAEQSQQSELRSARNDPGIRGDPSQVDMLSQDFDQSVKGEAELTQQLKGLQRRAEIFARTAEKMGQLIEAGDLTHQKDKVPAR